MSNDKTLAIGVVHTESSQRLNDSLELEGR